VILYKPLCPDPIRLNKADNVCLSKCRRYQHGPCTAVKSVFFKLNLGSFVGSATISRHTGTFEILENHIQDLKAGFFLGVWIKFPSFMFKSKRVIHR
jgi:hypothetical protein